MARCLLKMAERIVWWPGCMFSRVSKTNREKLAKCYERRGLNAIKQSPAWETAYSETWSPHRTAFRCNPHGRIGDITGMWMPIPCKTRHSLTSPRALISGALKQGSPGDTVKRDLQKAVERELKRVKIYTAHDPVNDHQKVKESEQTPRF